ncbi:aspartate carbamoyltransferase [Pseudomonadota bacterium AL_CKDN230030165-1A_HGKHYDSX7]
MFNPQLDRQGALAHLLTTEGLPRRLLEPLLDTAARHAAGACVPSRDAADAVALLFDVPDPFWRQACESAAERTGRACVAPGVPSLPRGAALPRWLAELPSRGVSTLVLRHGSSGAAHLAARHAPAGLRVINAGDGLHAQPLAALADLLAIRDALGGFTELTVTLLGDLVHSPSARSLIHALTTLGAPQLRAVAPAALLPDGLAELGVHAWPDLDSGVEGADVVVVVPLAHDSVAQGRVASPAGYAAGWRLEGARLAAARADAVVLHAGVDVAAAIELDAAVAQRARAPMAARAAHAQAAVAAVLEHLGGV